MEPPDNISRGWQPDPRSASRLRYWTGEEWTDKTKPESSGSPKPPAESKVKSAVKSMRLWPFLLGALVVLALIFVAPVLGAIALGVLAILALLSWIARSG